MIAAARFFPTIVDSGTALTDTVIFLFQGPPNSSIWWWNWNWRKWRYAERWSKSTSVSRQGCLPGLNHFKCCKHTFHSACFCCCCYCCCLILYLFFRVPKGILWLYLILSYHFFVTHLIKKSLHFLNPSLLKPEQIITCSHTWHPLMCLLKDLLTWKLLRHLLDQPGSKPRVIVTCSCAFSPRMASFKCLWEQSNCYQEFQETVSSRLTLEDLQSVCVVCF